LDFGLTHTSIPHFTLTPAISGLDTNTPLCIPKYFETDNRHAFSTEPIVVTHCIAIRVYLNPAYYWSLEEKKKNRSVEKSDRNKSHAKFMEKKMICCPWGIHCKF
jgi:hypothetical protein